MNQGRAIMAQADPMGPPPTVELVGFTSTLPTCLYCGAWHQHICPRIEEIEYHPNGTVKRVKLRPL